MEGTNSKLPFVHRRAGHVAVTWREITIVWGGCEYGPEENVHNEYWDPAEVAFHFEVGIVHFIRQFIRILYECTMY